VLTLPEILGGQTQVLCISGSYTFTLARTLIPAI
jgi:hypothetical protein